MKKIKKKKVNTKKILLVVIPLLIIILLFINRINIIHFYQSKITGYEFDTIGVFHELNIYDEVKKHPRSDTLEKIVKTEYYNPKYLDNYLAINYHDKDEYFNTINKLLDIGYNNDEINDIYNDLKDESIILLTDYDYLKDISTILDLPYFNEEALKRYLEYRKNKDIGYEDLITYVNAYLDYEYYTNVIDIDNPEDTKVLVNKYHKLASDYVPSDLEEINPKYNKGANNKLKHVAREAFEKMCEGALQDNIKIYSGSAYRSYNYQLNLYNRYVITNGFANAETFSARAGYSEHQTGLATDVMNARIDYISKSDKEYDWLINNSYKYGFILRYPEGKENITGYMYEEWHFRYLGEELATELYNSGLTYEEYVARNSQKKS